MIFIWFSFDSLVSKGETNDNKKESELKTLNHDDFMEMMLNNIQLNRKKYASKIVFESETKYVSCFVCPYNGDENK